MVDEVLALLLIVLHKYAGTQCRLFVPAVITRGPVHRTAFVLLPLSASSHSSWCRYIKANLSLLFYSFSEPCILVIIIISSNLTCLGKHEYTSLQNLSTNLFLGFQLRNLNSSLLNHSTHTVFRDRGYSPSYNPPPGPPPNGCVLSCSV